MAAAKPDSLTKAQRAGPPKAAECGSELEGWRLAVPQAAMLACYPGRPAVFRRQPTRLAAASGPRTSTFHAVSGSRRFPKSARSHTA